MVENKEEKSLIVEEQNSENNTPMSYDNGIIKVNLTELNKPKEMPFQNKKQMIACYAAETKAKKAGKKPSWDCQKWKAKTPKSVLKMCGMKHR